MGAQVPSRQHRLLGRRITSLPRLTLLAASLAFIGNPAFGLDINALPTGGKVNAGNASISQTANTLTVQQTSQRTVLDWQTFNVGSAAVVNFIQPGSSAVALNRILGIEASQIYGKLNANGQVFFSNPGGMLFSRGSQVHVGGILATTLSLTNDDFMAGNYKLTNPGTGMIRNEGIINALGSAALVGNTVQNAGQIFGTTVTLAAGNTVAIDLTGDGLIRARIEDAALKASIENSGSIEAAAAVTLTAGQAQSALDRVVNNSGVIRASGMTLKGGEILLEAAKVENTGSIVTASTYGGGTIKLMGDMVGGTVKVGGTLDASAPLSGNGGFVETSAAKVKIASDTKVTTTAATGLAGTWLIDPNDYTVAASGGDITGAVLGSNLNSGNVTIQNSAGATAGNGDIFVNDPVAWSSGNTLTLSAARDINIKSLITATGTSAGLTLNSNLGNVSGISNLNGTVVLNGGALRFTGGVLNLFDGGKIVGGTLTSSDGSQLVMRNIWTGGRLDNVLLNVDTTIGCGSWLVYYNNLTLANGHKITLASTGEYTWLSGGNDGAQLLATGGVGEVIFGGTSVNNIAIESSVQVPYALTIGPNVLIHSAPGALGGTVGNFNTAITNKGTIQTDNATVQLLFSSWTNTAGGVINVNGGALNLGANDFIGGPFNSSGLAGVTLNRTGGSVNLTGTMINTGNTFSLNGIGTLTLLNGSKIVGGTLTSSNGSQLIVGGSQSSATGTLDGVVLDVDATISNSNTLRYDNSLTIANGHKITLAATGAETWLSGGTVGAQLLATGGVGEVIFGGTSTSNYAVEPYPNYPYATNPYVLTIGPNVLIHGLGSGTIGYLNTVMNQGTIQADGGAITLFVTDFTNGVGGVIRTSGGTLNLAGNLTNSGVLDVASGTLIHTNNNDLINTQTGIIKGTGAVDVGTGTITNNGTLSPGSASAVGKLTVVGNLINNGTIELQVGGTTTGLYDVLAVTGNATLGGTLATTLANGFTPNGQTFDLITAGSMNGNFATVSLPSGSSSSTSITGTKTKAFSITATGGTSSALPTLDQCLATPSLVGCSSILPTLATCTSAPTTAGCTAVLPSFSACVANPTMAGCSAVLPSLATCATNPSTSGCSVILPSFTSCTTTPALAGCSAVLPALATCTATPSTAGCAAVLPDLATCMASPATSGCSAVLQSTGTQVVSNQVATITQTVVQNTIASATQSTTQVVQASTTQSVTLTSTTAAPVSTPDNTTSSGTSSSSDTSSGSITSGTTPASSSTSATQTVSSATSSDSSSTEKKDEKTVATPVVQTVVVANTTVQKPADQIVQIEKPKGTVLVCKIGG